MTREETVKIIRIICDCYPNYKPNNLSETVDVWKMMLEDYSYQEISIALKAYITTDINGFAPSVGQLIAKIQKISQPQELNEMAAWGLVSKALRNGTYGAAEEFEKLPPLVQKAVGMPDNLRNWAQSDYESIETVIQSNFIKTYRAVVSRSNEINRMPNEIKALIDKINSDSYSAQIEQNNQRDINIYLTDKNSLYDENTKDYDYVKPTNEFENYINDLKRR